MPSNSAQNLTKIYERIYYYSSYQLVCLKGKTDILKQKHSSLKKPKLVEHNYNHYSLL